MQIRFFVSGVPVTQGSAKAFRRGEKVVVTHDSGPKLRTWRQHVAEDARTAMGKALGEAYVVGDDGRIEQGLQAGAIQITLEYRLPRPTSLPKRVVSHTRKPDLDKLVRATLDALTGAVFVDDSQVEALGAIKVYAVNPEPQGLSVVVVW